MSDYAYAAGLIDGEGCIGFYPNGAEAYVLKIEVGMTSRPCLEFLQRLFGGSISSRKWYPGQNKQQYGWNISSRKAEAAIKSLLPFLVEKKRQAEYALWAREAQRADASDIELLAHFHVGLKKLK